MNIYCSSLLGKYPKSYPGMSIHTMIPVLLERQKHFLVERENECQMRQTFHKQYNMINTSFKSLSENPYNKLNL